MREMCLRLFVLFCKCVNPSALHGGISQVNPSHSLSDEKNTSSHPEKLVCAHLVFFFFVCFAFFCYQMLFCF